MQRAGVAFARDHKEKWPRKGPFSMPTTGKALPEP